MFPLIGNPALDSPRAVTAESQLGRVIEELCPTRVVWAVDVNEETDTAAIENLIQEMTETGRVLIEPVHVLVPEGSAFPRQLFSKWRDDLVYERAEQIRALRRTQPWVRGPRVIQRESGSRAGAVELLVEYAEQLGADLIIAKQSRRGAFLRALRPGFTDELVSQSRVPVLLFKEGSPPGGLPTSLHLPMGPA